MKREFLKELGIADDVMDKIMTEYGKDVESLKTQADKISTLKKGTLPIVQRVARFH